MAEGYSLYSELSGRHYWKGIIFLGRLQSVFPFAKGKIPVGFALNSVIFDYMGCGVPWVGGGCGKRRLSLTNDFEHIAF